MGRRMASIRGLVLCALLVITAMGFPGAQRGVSLTGDTVLARGAGRTIVEGGTGASAGFIPVVTSIAFHAGKNAGTVSGHLECLALAPPAASGAGSGQFTVNVMYVTGPITGAVTQGNTATLTGTASITGLGAGSNVPFTLVVRRGGPGATAVLTTGGLVFHEILLEGAFQVSSADAEE